MLFGGADRAPPAADVRRPIADAEPTATWQRPPVSAG